MSEGIFQAETLQTDAEPFFGKDFRHQGAEPADDCTVFQRNDVLLAARRYASCSRTSAMLAGDFNPWSSNTALKTF